MDMQNSTFATSACECSQITNVQETAPTNGASDSDPASGASSAASGATSTN